MTTQKSEPHATPDIHPAGGRDASFLEIAGALRTADRVLIYSHVRPDGDAIGSLLALGMALRQEGRNVVMWSQDGVPATMQFLAGTELVRQPPFPPSEFDAVVAVDTAEEKRGGEELLKAVLRRSLTVNIDHHATNPGYGDLCRIDPRAPATGEILFELIRAAELPFTSAVADALYVAIATDTGWFQYPATTARTYEVAAELVRGGVDAPAISARLNDNSPRRRFELMRIFLDRAVFSTDGRVADSALTLADATQAGAQPEDTEGLIDLIRAVDGVVVAAFFEELPDGNCRISLRSKSPQVDASRIAASFGGGGHPAAAGARLEGPLSEARQRVLTVVHHELGS